MFFMKGTSLLWIRRCRTVPWFISFCGLWRSTPFPIPLRLPSRFSLLRSRKKASATAKSPVPWQRTTAISTMWIWTPKTSSNMSQKSERKRSPLSGTGPISFQPAERTPCCGFIRKTWMASSPISHGRTSSGNWSDRAPSTWCTV